MRRIGLIAFACVAGAMLSPPLSVAATQPQTGVFTGVGNLWGGATRSDGAPPGCVPGVPCGQMAHQYGIAHQKGAPHPTYRWTKSGIQGAAR